MVNMTCMCIPLYSIMACHRNPICDFRDRFRCHFVPALMGSASSRGVSLKLVASEADSSCYRAFPPPLTNCLSGADYLTNIILFFHSRLMIRQMKNDCKYDCTNCGIPVYQRTLFCHYCQGDREAAKAKRSFLLHLVVLVLLIIFAVVIVV